MVRVEQVEESHFPSMMAGRALISLYVSKQFKIFKSLDLFMFINTFYSPLQAEAVGLERQLLTVFMSVVRVVQVVPSHFPVSTAGNDVCVL